MGPSAGPHLAGPRLGRLQRRPEFLRVAASGRKWSTPGLVLQADRRPAEATPSGSGAEAPRVGFTCSRRVGGAVVRNRAKRRLRAIADELLPGLALAGMDYVLIGRQATPSRPFALLKADLVEALERVARPRPAGQREPSPRGPRR